MAGRKTFEKLFRRKINGLPATRRKAQMQQTLIAQKKGMQDRRKLFQSFEWGSQGLHQ
jgi:hypothetical protein